MINTRGRINTLVEYWATYRPRLVNTSLMNRIMLGMRLKLAMIRMSQCIGTYYSAHRISTVGIIKVYITTGVPTRVVGTCFCEENLEAANNLPI